MITFKETLAKTLYDLENDLNYDYSLISVEAVRELQKKFQEAKIRFKLQRKLTTEDEVYYAKNIKCYILAKINFYQKMYKILMNKPPSSKEELKHYYLKEHFKVKKQLIKFSSYQQYYLVNEKDLDKIFFRNVLKTFNIDGTIIKKKQANHFFLNFYIDIKVLYYLRTALKRKIKSFDINNDFKGHQLNWTASKTDLIELIYALNSTGVFNNGKAAIKEIVNVFQSTFSVDLIQHNRVFYAIKLRKTNKTKYIDQLREQLINKINSTDYELFTE